MELNVVQSGISHRIQIPSYFKNRAGRVNKRVAERYLRNDLPCGWKSCQECSGFTGMKELTILGSADTNTSCSVDHAILIDAQTLIRFYDIFDSELLQNVIITQAVWEYVRSKSIVAYKKINSFCYEQRSPRFSVFMSEFHHMTYIPSEKGISEEERLEKSIASCATYLTNHWNGKITPVVICADEATLQRSKSDGMVYLTIRDYVSGMIAPEKQEILDKMAAYDSSRTSEKENIYEEHLSHDDIVSGIARGDIKKGNFTVSRENYREATVMVDNSNLTSWFIQGMYCNRAVNGDTVAVQLLPESEWTAPEKTIRLRDVEEISLKADEMESDDSDEPARKKAKLVIPTAKVVGIIKRNWRPYCGIILPSVIKGGRRHLFCPAERLIPRIRIETDQADTLARQRIVVQIDHWPRDSKYPLGHYVRTLGNLGDKETENEVLLLEHDIPHAPFSDAVLDCLPKDDWKPNSQALRVDLRHLTICSVDPVGCTDIDDALHCKDLGNGIFEVGVHIADVTHFVRPGTAIDEEASSRGTTVYLCDRRIDMLPAMLSSNLCSLRGNEERYAFSVIWNMTAEAEITSVKFHKSLICSKAALTYEKAQEFIDNPELGDDVTTGLRGLMKLSKVLNARRTANGALTLASPEVRFDMDWESRTPKKVMLKEHLDTHSMVEEFMLLANIAVAEKILAEYPDCALLRRHPIPAKESYKPLIEAAKRRGIEIQLDSGKALADSLNQAIDKKNPMLNRLLRMITTRCMTQAVYFSSGTIPVPQYQHFGLACPIYTHFTSPIRRYADVIVHRLLAACTGSDDIGTGLLSQANVQKTSLNINYRHKQAQYAGRASVQLNVLYYFKGKEEDCEAFIMGVRKNGIQVFVPKYGLESIIVLKDGKGASVDADEGCVRSGEYVLRELDRLTVKVRLDERNIQRPRIALDLIDPPVPGLSVDFDLTSSEGLGI